MYSVVLLMALSNGPANDMPEPSIQAGTERYGDHLRHEQFRRRRGGCCGGGGGGGCHGGYGGYGGGCYGGYGGYGGGCYGGYGGYGGYSATPMAPAGAPRRARYDGMGMMPSYGGQSWNMGQAPLQGQWYMGQAPLMGGDGYQSFYPSTATQGGSAPAVMVVHLPPDAQLTIDDNPTVSTNSTRVFVSPPLDPNKEYTYHLRAKAFRDGREVTEHKPVKVRPGQQTQVVMDFRGSDRDMDRDRGTDRDRDADRTRDRDTNRGTRRDTDRDRESR